MKLQTLLPVGMAVAGLCAGACTDTPTPGDLTIESIAPASGPIGEAVAVEILGSGFDFQIRVDLDEDTWQAEAPAVTIGSLALEDVELTSSTRLAAVVPAALPAGAHDVVVSYADGRRATLAGGYRVVGDCDDADGDGFTAVACGGDDCDDDVAACGADCFPGNPAADVCDGFDQDCDDTVDEDTTCGDGMCCRAAGQDAATCAADCATELLDDPFGDGTPFTYIAGFDGQVYLGPSADGDAAVRFDPDGSGAETVGFTLPADATGNTSRNTATPPFSSIGATGCAQDTPTCGPDNENGRGFFASGMLAGVEWLVLGGARSEGDLDYVYMTPSSAAPLAFRYVDLSQEMGGQTKGFSALHVHGDRIYMGFPDTGGERPYLIALLVPPDAPGLDAASTTEALNIEADNLPGMQTPSTAIIDAIADFNDRVYLANSTGWVRSTVAAPGPGDSAPGDWVSDLPSAAAFVAKASTVTDKTADLEPVDRAVPQMAVFNGRLYAARNTTDGPQLWACDPAVAGEAAHCDPDDWALVAPNSTGDAQLTQFDNPSNTAITMLVATPEHLYVGYDNADDGLVIFRTAAATPTARGDFEGDGSCSAAAHPAGCEGIGGAGLGNAANTRIFFAIALQFGDDASVYLSVGSGADAVRIHRLQ